MCIWCEIWSDRYRLIIGFAPNQEALTCGARRLNGEFLECGDRMPKLAAFFGRSFDLWDCVSRRNLNA